MQYEMNRWGLHGNSKESSKFRTYVMNAVIEKSKYKEDNPIDIDFLKRDDFPKDLKDAYEYLLHCEILPSPYYNCQDTLDVNYSRPYYKKYDRYFKRDNFKKFSKWQLDPLRRFIFHQVSEAEELFDRWIVNENKSAMLGTLFEAAVTIHALQKEACFNCKCRNSLRWNGAESWQDLVCIQCQCIFEVKTKSDMEQIERCFMNNYTPAGSFGCFCNIYNSKRPNQKIFLVMLPRKATFNRNREFVHPVTIAEIDSIVPSLHEDTFNKKKRGVDVASVVQVKLNTRANWFDLPVLSKVSMYEVRKKVFIERFSEGTFASLRNAHMELSDALAPSVEECSAKIDEDSSLSNLSKELKQMEIPDNWEDEESE